MIGYYDSILKKLGEIKGFKPKRRPLIERVLKDIESSEKPFFIVKAPTGYGKTTISYTLALYSLYNAEKFDKVIHILPMRSIVEDLSMSAKELFDFSRAKMMGVSEEVFHLFPLNFTTIDTFIWDVLKLNTKKFSRIKDRKEFGYDFFTQASILNSMLIFDEAHFILEDDKLKSIFLCVLKFLVENDVPILILTATLSKGYEELFKKYAIPERYDFRIYELSDENGKSSKSHIFVEDKEFLERERNKNFEISIFDENFVGNYLKYVEEGKRNIIVANSPKKCVKIYDMALEESRFDNILLIHGKMTYNHRKRVVEKIRNLKNEKEFLIISTQVIEAGVDISSDIMITEIAPPNSLIQRFGRVARYNEKEGKIIILKSDGKPYNKEKIEKTWTYLESNMDIHPRFSKTYQEWIDKVHGKSLANAEAKIGRHKRITNILIEKLREFRTRSFEIYEIITKYISEGHAFLRDFLIPVEVENDVVLITPKELFKLCKLGKIDVIRIKKIENNIVGEKLKVKDENEAYKVAIDIACGEPIEVKLLNGYDKERGLIL
ncbi:MAG: CRISPR-associated helicase Cas3' [Methanocaldococcus sp.]